MRVLVTRPEPAATRTAEKLRSMGHDPVLMPLAAARRLPGEIEKALQINPGAPLIVTSREAVRTLGEIESSDPERFGRPVFAVGPATAEAARELGFSLVTAAGGDGISLARLIVESVKKHDRAQRQLLYLAGTPRSQALETSLRKAGIGFRTCECYLMEALHPSMEEQLTSLTALKPGAVLHYSSESLLRFLALPTIVEKPDLVSEIIHFCLSEAVAKMLPDNLSAKTRIADSPSEDSLLSLL